MCIFDCFFKKTESNSSNNLTAALVDTKVYGTKVYGANKSKDQISFADIYPEKEPVLRCQLCNLTPEVSVLPCKHIMCKGCVETQKLYIYKDCLICENMCWTKLIPPNS